jgi:hypothetical protein
MRWFPPDIGAMSDGNHCISYNNKKGFMQQFSDLRGWAKTTGTSEDVYVIGHKSKILLLRNIAKLLGEGMRRVIRLGVTLETRPRLAEYSNSEAMGVIFAIPSEFESMAKTGTIWAISAELFRQFRIQLALDGDFGYQAHGIIFHAELRLMLPDCEDEKTVTFRHWRIFGIQG